MSEIVLPWKGNFNKTDVIVYSRKVIFNKDYLMKKFGFSAKEIEIVAMLVDGKTNAQIAKHICRAVKTVKFHLSSIFQKLGVANRVEAAVVVIEALEGKF